MFLVTLIGSKSDSGGIEKEWRQKILVKSTLGKEKNKGTKESRQVIADEKTKAKVAGWNEGKGTKTISYEENVGIEGLGGKPTPL